MRTSLVTITIVTLTLCVLRHNVSAEDVVRMSPRGGSCSGYALNAAGVPPVNSSIPIITQSITDWQGIVLVVSFGAAGLLVGLIHRLVRTYVYFDAHLLDTFFDAGGDVSVGLVASSVVAKWTWTTSYTWSVYYVTKYGAVGQFWSAAGLVIQLFLFSILACEIRIKAPGAKTFLQVIRARFGAPAHVILMIFALFVNLVIASMVMYEGTNILYSLIADVKKEIFALIFAVCIAIFTVVGGVGGSLYFCYVGAVFIIALLLVFIVEVFYDPFNRQVEPLGSWEQLYSVVDCYKANGSLRGTALPADNEADSPLTFLSRGGMIEGVIMILALPCELLHGRATCRHRCRPGHAPVLRTRGPTGIWQDRHSASPDVDDDDDEEEEYTIPHELEHYLFGTGNPLPPSYEEATAHCNEVE